MNPKKCINIFYVFSLTILVGSIIPSRQNYLKQFCSVFSFLKYLLLVILHWHLFIAEYLLALRFYVISRKRASFCRRWCCKQDFQNQQRLQKHLICIFSFNQRLFFSLMEWKQFKNMFKIQANNITRGECSFSHHKPAVVYNFITQSVASFVTHVESNPCLTPSTSADYRIPQFIFKHIDFRVLCNTETNSKPSEFSYVWCRDFSTIFHLI